MNALNARCYTGRQVREKLQMSQSAFTRLKQQGLLPFLEELRPRLGHNVRYRADLVDRYLAGQWGVSVFGRKRA